MPGDWFFEMLACKGFWNNTTIKGINLISLLSELIVAMDRNE